MTALTAVVVLALGAAASASAQTVAQNATSANWSGYAVGGSGTQFRSVSGSWVEPSVRCASGEAYSSFWVGLGGSGQAAASNSMSATDGTGAGTALEQAGTEVDCSASGQASHHAWYELVPEPPVPISMAVHPGDTMSSRVTVQGTSVTIELHNHTTGASFHKTLTVTNPNVSTAEWIAEAPSTCAQGATNCSPLPLADFGKVAFSGATATTTTGHTGTITDGSWSAVAVSLNPNAAGYGGPTFASDSSGAAAAPSQLSADGSAFSVAWSGGATSVAGSSGGYGYAYPSAGYGYPGSGYGYAYPASGYGYAYPGGYAGYGYPGGYGY
ncbi:MAG: G1 family glutamic endopeptidase [Solirubrobacteraceae bacterium]